MRMFLVRAAQAWALLHGRPGVVPEDVQAVVRAVAGHRLELRTAAARYLELTATRRAADSSAA